MILGQAQIRGGRRRRRKLVRRHAERRDRHICVQHHRAHVGRLFEHHHRPPAAPKEPVQSLAIAVTGADHDRKIERCGHLGETAHHRQRHAARVASTHRDQHRRPLAIRSNRRLGERTAQHDPFAAGQTRAGEATPVEFLHLRNRRIEHEIRRQPALGRIVDGRHEHAARADASSALGGVSSRTSGRAHRPASDDRSQTSDDTTTG